jgi:hypothetical protein
MTGATAAGDGQAGDDPQSAVLACGAALFLSGDAAIRRQLLIGPARLRLLAAVPAPGRGGRADDGGQRPGAAV